MTRRRRLVLRAVILLVPLYALVVTFGGCANRMLLHPSRHPIDAGAAVRLTVPHDGRQIEVWSARSPALAGGGQPRAYVLEFCGNATRAEEIAQFVAQRWQKHPVEVWVMNYPGFGGSEGRARLASVVPSAMATFDELARRAGGRPIFIEANSMGTVPALRVAASRPVAGLVLQNPPPLRRLILRRYGWWNLCWRRDRSRSRCRVSLTASPAHAAAAHQPSSSSASVTRSFRRSTSRWSLTRTPGRSR